MERLFKASFWNAACARAMRTAAQGLLASLAGCTMIHELDWALIGSMTAVAVLASFLTSIVKELPEEE